MTEQNTQQAAQQQVQAAVKAGQDTVEQAMKASKDTVQKAVKVSKENAEKALKASQDAVTKGYDQAITAAKEQVQKTFPEAAPKFDEFAKYQKDNIDAFFAASAIATKGFETVTEELMAYNQQAFDNSVAAAKKLLDCKTFQDAVEVQTDYARANFDRMVAEGTKFSELTVKVANETAEPFQSRVNKTVETFSKPIAS
jgi:phasin family protein